MTAHQPIEYFGELSVIGAATVSIGYLALCMIRKRDVDLAYLPRLFATAGLPSAAAFLYGAVHPPFLNVMCGVQLECLSLGIRLALAFGGMCILTVIAQTVGLIKISINSPKDI